MSEAPLAKKTADCWKAGTSSLAMLQIADLLLHGPKIFAEHPVILWSSTIPSGRRVKTSIPSSFIFLVTQDFVSGIGGAASHFSFRLKASTSSREERLSRIGLPKRLKLPPWLVL